MPMEWHPEASMIVVAGSPSADDVGEGRPLVGADGGMVTRALRDNGVPRSGAAYTTAVACRFPGDDTKAVLDRIARHNRKNKLHPGMEDYQPSPFDCCAPRLDRDVTPFRNRIPLGGHAAQALIPERKTAHILPIRGHKFEIDESTGRAPARVFPTLAPRFVSKQRRWAHVFDQDIRHALAWFRGQDTWVQPRFVNARYTPDGSAVRDEFGRMSFKIPTVAQIRSYLRGPWETSPWKEKPRWMLYDLETDGIRTDVLDIRCMGVGGPDHVLIIPFRSVNLLRDPFYTQEEEAEIIEIIREWAEDETILKVGHNAGGFDRMACKAVWGFEPTPLMDTVLVHKGVDAELPHTLNFVGSYYVSIHAWKEENGGLDLKYDATLWEYCGLDCVVNARCAHPLVVDAMKRTQLTARIPPLSQLHLHISRDPVTRDHAMQAMGVQLQRIGLPVRQDVRAEKEAEAIKEMQRWVDRTHALLRSLNVPRSAIADAGVRIDDEDGDDDEELMEEFVAFDDAAAAVGLDLDGFNPCSHHQVRKLVTEVWDLPEPIGLSKTAMRTGATGDGDLRTGRAVLQAYMTDRRLTPQQRSLFHSIFMVRRWAKRYGSEARPTRYDLAAIAAAEQGRRYDGPKLARCVLHRDGRIHSNWNAHGTLVGRWATSNPNSQNLSLWFKPCIGYAEDDEYTMVGADVEGIHLRIIAVLWGVPSLREAFELGYDAHALRAEKVLGDTYRKAEGYAGYGKKPGKRPDGKPTLAAKLRDMVKTLTYAGAYGAEPPTIYRVMRGAVDEEGRIQMPDLRLEQVEVMHDQWMRSEPEWERAWNRNIAAWKAQGFVASPLLGRRRYFLDENENDVRNYEILSAEGDIMGEVTQRFVNAVPFEYNGPGTGLILQCHDALYAGVLKHDAERVRGIMRECMNEKYGPIQLKAGSVDIGNHMGKVAV